MAGRKDKSKRRRSGTSRRSLGLSTKAGKGKIRTTSAEEDSRGEPPKTKRRSKRWRGEQQARNKRAQRQKKQKSAWKSSRGPMAAPYKGKVGSLEWVKDVLFGEGPAHLGLTQKDAEKKIAAAVRESRIRAVVRQRVVDRMRAAVALGKNLKKAQEGGRSQLDPRRNRRMPSFYDMPRGMYNPSPSWWSGEGVALGIGQRKGPIRAWLSELTYLSRRDMIFDHQMYDHLPWIFGKKLGAKIGALYGHYRGIDEKESRRRIERADKRQAQIDKRTRELLARGEYENERRKYTRAANRRYSFKRSPLALKVLKKRARRIERYEEYMVRHGMMTKKTKKRRSKRRDWLLKPPTAEETRKGWEKQRRKQVAAQEKAERAKPKKKRRFHTRYQYSLMESTTVEFNRTLIPLPGVPEGEGFIEDIEEVTTDTHIPVRVGTYKDVLTMGDTEKAEMRRLGRIGGGTFPAYEKARVGIGSATSSRNEHVLIHLARMLGNLEGYTLNAVQAAVIPIMKRSQELVPTETGALKRSAYRENRRVRGNRWQYAFGYAKNGEPHYALAVHERVTDEHGNVIFHKPPTKAKFLEIAFQENEDKIIPRMKQEMAKWFHKGSPGKHAYLTKVRGRGN